MAIPTFVGAGPGLESLVAGTQTVSKTGCTAGNFIITVNFDADDTGGGSWTAGTVVNIAALDGTPNSTTTWVNSTNRQFMVGRVMANGTVSRDVTVVAGDVDNIARIYEFSGVSLGTTLAEVRESSGEAGPLTDTTIQDRAITTLGPDRLALNFVNVRASAVIGTFSGQTGGTWSQATQYNGSTLSQQLETAPMTSAGTIDGGTITQASAYWLVTGCALIPGPLGGYANAAWLSA